MKLITLAKQYNYTCYWCKKKWKLEDLTRDHIIPYSQTKKSWKRGGGHSRKGKCVLACIICNGRRGNLPMDMFKEKINP